jgi:hypothetical protein
MAEKRGAPAAVAAAERAGEESGLKLQPGLPAASLSPPPPATLPLLNGRKCWCSRRGGDFDFPNVREGWPVEDGRRAGAGEKGEGGASSSSIGVKIRLLRREDACHT